ATTGIGVATGRGEPPPQPPSSAPAIASDAANTTRLRMSSRTLPHRIVGVTATSLDGKATAAAIKEELRVRLKALADRGVRPGLGTILVGDDPASQAYVSGKHRDSAELGILSLRRDLPAGATQADVEAAVEAAVDELNADPSCTGFLVQLPLPKGLDEQRVLERVDPDKDVDGLHPVNLGRLVLMHPGPVPATARATPELLRRHDVPFA